MGDWMNYFNRGMNYLKKNGVKDTFYASVERISDRDKYSFRPISFETMKKQMGRNWKKDRLFSLVVPAYETEEKYLRELIDAVISQTYVNWELLIVDSSESEAVSRVVDAYKDKRIRYIKLKENKGISANTNTGIAKARGEYIGLIDHDDFITPNPLFEFAIALEKADDEGKKYAFIYSDEDKCDSMGVKFFEPNIKPGFNLDLLLTNNYICHFLMVEAGLLKNLKLRPEYDGAQDHDLLLRLYHTTFNSNDGTEWSYGHIPKVLYHWRSHKNSTSTNTESKSYAYEAGQRAIEDYCEKAKLHVKVLPLKHCGFFRLEYKDYLNYGNNVNRYNRMVELTDSIRGKIAYRLMLNRFDIGVIGGPVIKKNKVVGGMLDETKTCPFDGLNINFSGYLHRAVLQQDAYGVDVRNMFVNAENFNTVYKNATDEQFAHLFNREAVESMNDTIKADKLDSPYVDVSALLSENYYGDFDYINVSTAICADSRMEGYTVYYDPEFLFFKRLN